MHVVKVSVIVYLGHHAEYMLELGSPNKLSRIWNWCPLSSIFLSQCSYCLDLVDLSSCSLTPVYAVLKQMVFADESYIRLQTD